MLLGLSELAYGRRFDAELLCVFHMDSALHICYSDLKTHHTWTKKAARRVRGTWQSVLRKHSHWNVSLSVSDLKEQFSQNWTFTHPNENKRLYFRMENIKDILHSCLSVWLYESKSIPSTTHNVTSSTCVIYRRKSHRVRTTWGRGNQSKRLFSAELFPAFCKNLHWS